MFDGLAVKLPVCERVSQVLVLQVCSFASAVALILAWAVTESVCEAGAVPPETAVNVKAVELRVRAGVTVRVTLKTTDPRLDVT